MDSVHHGCDGPLKGQEKFRVVPEVEYSGYGEAGENGKGRSRVPCIL